MSELTARISVTALRKEARGDLRLQGEKAPGVAARASQCLVEPRGGEEGEKTCPVSARRIMTDRGLSVTGQLRTQFRTRFA